LIFYYYLYLIKFENIIGLAHDVENERENKVNDDDDEDEQRLLPIPIKTEDIKNASNNEKQIPSDGYQSCKTGLNIFYLSMQVRFNLLF
jgi:hypothetical protein